MTTQTLCLADFATSFGTSEQTFSQDNRTVISNTDFRYRTLDGDEAETLILRILKRIDEDTQVVGAEDRRQVWEQGWQQNLDEFRDSNFDGEKLVPKFIRHSNPVRLNQTYVLPEHPEFELNFVKVYRRWFLEHYFANVDNIYEFGCGTGFNLLAAAELFPEKALFGSDFVQSSVDLVNLLAESRGIRLSGALFDMIHPDPTYRIARNSGVFTFGSLEQLASSTEAMLHYLIDQKPSICVHTEPAIELYQPDNLVDYLAIKFQNKRGYSAGIIPKLHALEAQGKIEVIKIKRLYFGSLFMEGYNLIAWAPR